MITLKLKLNPFRPSRDQIARPERQAAEGRQHQNRMFANLQPAHLLIR